MATAPLIAGTLAQDCYPASPQALFDEMFAKGAAALPDISGVLVQDAAPAPEYRGVMGWIPTAGNIPIYPGYVFVWHATVGHWVCRNPIGPMDGSLRLYTGTAASIDTYDGGDTNAAGIASGPMWEIAAALEGRVPIGVGTIPGSANSVAVNGTTDSSGASGEYEHVLTAAEGAVGDHVHPIGVCDPTSDDGFFNMITPPATTAAYNAHYITGSGSTPLTPETTANLYTLQANDGNGVTSDGHNNMQPYVGVYFLKRTAREFFVMG